MSRPHLREQRRNRALRPGSGVCETRLVGPSVPFPACVVRVACDSSGVGPLFGCLANESSEHARRRRPGARCWLDQELVLLVRGVTHHRPAARFPCSRPAYRTLRVGGSVGMLADELDYVIGVDTHRDQHVLAVVAAPTGALIGQRSVPTNAQATARRSVLPSARAGARLWAVEGAGHYGAAWPAVCRLRRGRALERPQQPCRAALRGKDDPLDATRAARSALASNQPRRRDRGNDRRLCACSSLLAAAPSTCVGRTRPTPQPDRDRTRRAPQRAAAAAVGRAASTLQPLPPLELADTRPTRDYPRTNPTQHPHYSIGAYSGTLALKSARA